MQFYNDKTALSYDDVILVPQYSSLMSRSDVDTSATLGNFTCKTPIISSNMDTVTDADMAIAMWQCGGLGALQRVKGLTHCLDSYRTVQRAECNAIVSVGANDDSRILLKHYYEFGARAVLVDVAHAHSIQMGKMLQWVRATYPDMFIIAGNVATASGARFLVSKGACAVKVGIGAGSACKTRIVTGHGYPSFSSIAECRAATSVPIIADGGLRSSGDIVKAFAAGANFVMLGSLFAGADETPGEFLCKDGMPHKTYRGMASSEVLNDYRDVTRIRPAAEGVSTFVRAKGPVKLLVDELTAGLRSGMSYCNARTIDEIHKNALVAIQTTSGMQEGIPHILS